MKSLPTATIPIRHGRRQRSCREGVGGEPLTTRREYHPGDDRRRDRMGDPQMNDQSREPLYHAFVQELFYGGDESEEDAADDPEI